MSEMLMKVQIGPVQEFIAQARSTRDMWAGSYLLSWLTAAAMKTFAEAGCDFVFPTLEDQPLYKMFNGTPSDAGLIPTLPNVFMMLVPKEQIKTLSIQAEDALRAELKKIGDACWKEMEELIKKLDSKDQPKQEEIKEWKARWDNQIDRFPIFNWCAVDYDGVDAHWSNTVETLGTQMAARRNTREFDQWGWEERIDPKDGKKKWMFDDTNIGAVKDILSGKEEAIGSEDFWKQDYWKKAGPFGAMNCIKRLFPEAYLEKRFGDRKKFWDKMRVEDTRDISMKNKESANPYMAVIAFDGDRMGAALKTLTTKDEHTKFSQTLATFAEKEVSSIVNAHQGQLVYAGGDDVLVMCPADEALELAESLAEQFRETMEEYNLDASCGIAVGHYQFPLQRIVDEARKAESRAKNKRGRAAFALTLLKRSGEIIHWGAKWESPALVVYKDFTDKSSGENPLFSGRFPYALAELLQPYRLADLRKGDPCDRPDPSDHPVSPDQLRGIIAKEYEHVLARQSSKGDSQVAHALDYLEKLSEETLSDFPTLFLASAFMNRQRGEN